MSRIVKIVLIAVAALVICGIVIILMVPTLDGPSRHKTTNSHLAFTAMLTLNSAEAEFNSTYPQHGFACTLTTLGGSPRSGALNSEAAQIITEDLASGSKAGYKFSIVCTNRTRVKNQDRYLGYRITAVPIALHRTGDRGYCTDQDGKIKSDPSGGTNCTELLQ